MGHQEPFPESPRNEGGGSRFNRGDRYRSAVCFCTISYDQKGHCFMTDIPQEPEMFPGIIWPSIYYNVVYFDTFCEFFYILLGGDPLHAVAIFYQSVFDLLRT
ncbi:hypothetical protein JKG47_14160 [Acidithiobacillus sp. MC6.1]|nr:hypothetical protein [Acidithiobacillus sp. MC6.1]